MCVLHGSAAARGEASSSCAWCERQSSASVPCLPLTSPPAFFIAIHPVFMPELRYFTRCLSSHVFISSPFIFFSPPGTSTGQNHCAEEYRNTLSLSFFPSRPPAPSLFSVLRGQRRPSRAQPTPLFIFFVFYLTLVVDRIICARRIVSPCGSTFNESPRCAVRQTRNFSV